MMHLSRTLGGNLGFDYVINSKLSAFIKLDANAVGNLSKFEQGLGDEPEGYRFDGLRYNYKLGISWKI